MEEKRIYPVDKAATSEFTPEECEKRQLSQFQCGLHDCHNPAAGALYMTFYEQGTPQLWDAARVLGSGGMAVFSDFSDGHGLEAYAWTCREHQSDFKALAERIQENKGISEEMVHAIIGRLVRQKTNGRD